MEKKGRTQVKSVEFQNGVLLPLSSTERYFSKPLKQTGQGLRRRKQKRRPPAHGFALLIPFPLKFTSIYVNYLTKQRFGCNEVGVNGILKKVFLQFRILVWWCRRKNNSVVHHHYHHHPWSWNQITKSPESPITSSLTTSPVLLSR